MKKVIDNRLSTHQKLKFGEFLTRVQKAGYQVSTANASLDEYEIAHFGARSGSTSFGADEFLDNIQYWPTNTGNSSIAATALIKIL